MSHVRSRTLPWFLLTLAGLSGFFFFVTPSPWPLLILLILGCLELYGLFRAPIIPYFLLFAILCGQLVRLRISGDSSGSLLLLDIGLAAYVALGSLHLGITRKRFPLTLSLISLGGFLLWMIISLVLGSSVLTAREVLVALFYLVRFCLMCASLWITLALLQKEKAYETLTRGLVVTGLALVALGYIQLVFFPNFSFMTQFGWDPHEGRLLSTFFDPNFFGMFLVMLSSLLLSQLLVQQEVRAQKRIWLALGLTIAALLATFSRSSYLAFLISFLTIFLIRSWKLVIVSLICIAVLGAAVPRVRTRIIGAVTLDATAQDRIQSWKEASYIIRDHPVFGVGYNAFGPAQLRYGIRQNLESHASRGSDSSFLLVLATTGAIGLGLYLLFLLSLFYESLLAYRLNQKPHFQAIGLALAGIIPAYIVHSQFVNSLFYPLLFIPFTFLVANLIYGLKHQSTSHTQDEPAA